MNEKRFEMYIREGDNRETATCKALLDDFKVVYTDVSQLNCDECPCADDCENSFLGRKAGW